MIHLNKVNTITGLYGSRKTYKTIAVSIDDAIGFKTKVESAKTDLPISKLI
ncbi:hypothetical protein [Winogradskyella haliclonae]|uniref:Uncharacterized protein n=1 Tax=Winogradskyella haliclonae TaxID=2048558 RepID=A0ABQ2BZ50_9FLAO|nr:hypothetical protein [Winogradskyella haliclonae]GGI57215.1 hypothetical protein GCM10011444_15240 [Winogradskyella haliclonae]